ncbi:hypothetical protein ACIQXF_12420 [Lysinibacillus sp. NPDC097231]
MDEQESTKIVELLRGNQFRFGVKNPHKLLLVPTEDIADFVIRKKNDLA